MERKVRYYKPRTGESGELVLLGLPESVTQEDIDIPTKLSELSNDAGFITAATAPVRSVNSYTGDVVLYAEDVEAIALGSIEPMTNAEIENLLGGST